MHHPYASTRRDGERGAGVGEGKGEAARRTRLQPHIIAEVFELSDLLAAMLLHPDLPADLRLEFHNVLQARAARV